MRDSNHIDKQYIEETLLKMSLKEIREAHHLTQKEVSARTGLSVSTIRNIESDTGSSPTLNSINRYLTLFGYHMRLYKGE